MAPTTTPASSPGRRPRPWLTAGVVVLLLAAHAVLAYTATLGASTTFDEPLHMVAGVAYWTRGDYRLQPENGNLPQRWCALPLLFMNLSFPTLDQPPWRESEAILLGRQFLYTVGNDPQAMLAAARAMAMVWPVALCLVVFLWSRSIYGTAGGLVSLALAACWPAVVAHGPLATSDACGAVFFTLGAWSLWELAQRLTPGTLAAAFFAVGIAPVAKHTTIMLGPLAILYLALLAVLGRPLEIAVGPWRTSVPGPLRRTTLALAALVVPLGAAVVFIWASCGFRYAAAGPGCGPVEFRLYQTLEACAEHAGGIGRICAALAAWRLLPEGWLYGMCYVGATVRIRNAFAVGHYSIHGWWWYFPLCLAIKNTLPGLGLTAWGVGRACRDLLRVRAGQRPLAPTTFAALAPLGVLAVLWPTFLTSHLNIGERHLLPSYPALLVLAGGTLNAVRSGWPRRLIVILLAVHALDVAGHWPSSLAYFNQIVPRGRGSRWLVDSNLDWGQDLLRLRTWLDRNRRPAEPVYHCYFGSDLPERVLPAAEELGVAPAVGTAQVLRPGLYCVSATHLQAVYQQPFGPWCKAFEETYQRARAYVNGGADDATGAADIVARSRTDRLHVAPEGRSEDPTVSEAAVYAFNVLQTGRLLAFLRHRAPDADVGGSILLFRLTAADLEAALAGPPAELQAESWMHRDSGGDAAALVRRGDRLFDEGLLVEAEETLEQARRLDPTNAAAWARLGIVYAARGRDRQAVVAYTKAARLAPHDPEPVYNLGNLFAARGEPDKAIEAYGAALARDAGFRQAYFNRGILRLRGGAAAAAVADFQAFVRLGGTLPDDLQPLLGPPVAEPTR